MGHFAPTDWNEGIAPGISAAQLDRMEAGIDEALRVLEKDTSDVAVGNTTTETDLFSYTLPANTLERTGLVKVVLAGTVKFNAAGNLVIKTKLDSGEVVESSAIDLADDAEYRSWLLEWWLTPEDGQDTNPNCDIRFSIGPPLVSGALLQMTASDFVMGIAHTRPTGPDITSAIVLKMTAKWSAASANLNITKRMHFVALHANS